jgi:NAD dependent epimerase/dehydratase
MILKKVLVTGAGGFIASHLTDRLVQLGVQVRAFVHYNSRNDWGLLEQLDDEVRHQIEVFPGDLTDASLVRRAVSDCQVVFHLGALIAIPYSYQAPQQFIATNVFGTLNILQACLETKVDRLIHTSTSEVYGSARYTPMDEEHPLQAQSPYAASKIAADKLVESFRCSYGLPVTIIRPFNTFGPRQSARAVIPTIISQALSANTVKLGSLAPVRDFTFVEDTVSAFIKAAESEETVGRLLNIGTGRGVTIGEVADAIFRLCDRNVHVETDETRLRPSQSEVMALICNGSKARQLLGWEPEYTLEKGLQHTIEYVNNHIARYKPHLFNL